MSASDLAAFSSSYLSSSSNLSTLAVPHIPLALYIHIPWCVQKCPYCDFNSHPLNLADTVVEDKADKALKARQKGLAKHANRATQQGRLSSSLFASYVDALLADASSQMALTQGRQIGSLFIGGGTPSLLPVAQYQRLFTGLKTCFRFAEDIEVTMEANPGTLEHAPFAEYLEVGINRLSIGVQSFETDKLARLGRIHDGEQAKQAILAARKAGFERVNVDLMHGLPEQTAAAACQDIQQAYDCGATHLSWYQLTIEPNTVFYRNQPILPVDEQLAQIEKAGSERLKRLGYRQYEVSAWVGTDDQPCRHNVNYWQFGDYLAIGAGAHGKVSIDGVSKIQPATQTETNPQANSTECDEGVINTGIYRFSKSRLPKDYMQAVVPKFINWQALSTDELPSDYMMNALRLMQPLSLRTYQQRTGLGIDSILPACQRLQDQGLLIVHSKASHDGACHDDIIIETTELGRRYLNQVMQGFI